MARQTLPLAATIHVALARVLDWTWPSGAAWAYADAIALAPEAAELHFLRGQALSRARRWTDASVAFASAARLAPTSVEYQGALVIALHHAGRDTDLLEALWRLAQLRPGQGEMHLLIGAVLRRAGRQAEALRSFRLGVRLPPTPASLRFLLGEVLLGPQGWQDTLAAWRQARAIDAPGPDASGGRSALNFHPGRAPEPMRGRVQPPARTPLAWWVALKRHWPRWRARGHHLAQRAAGVLALDRRVRALRRASHRTRLRPGCAPQRAV